MVSRKQYSEAIQINDMVTERIDGELFEYNRSSRCKVCSGPAELSKVVDSMLVQPYSFAAIISLIEPLQDKLGIPEKERIKYTSLINHRRNHLPFEKIAYRLLLEEKARQRGKKVLEGADSLLTADAYFTRITDLSWENINSGKTVPTVTEGMKAMQFKYEIERDEEGDGRYSLVMNQFNLLLKAMKEVCSEEQQAQIVAKLEGIRNNEVAAELIEEIEDAVVVNFEREDEEEYEAPE